MKAITFSANNWRGFYLYIVKLDTGETRRVWAHDMVDVYDCLPNYLVITGSNESRIR